MTVAPEAPTPARAKAKRIYRKTCPECGQRFETHSHDRTFCSEPHKAAFHNRSSKIGRAVIPLALAWRLGRHATGNTPEARAKRAAANRAMNEMVALLDAGNRDDRETGRMSKLEYVMNARLAAGFRYADETVAGQTALIEREKADAARKAAEQPNGFAPVKPTKESKV